MKTPLVQYRYNEHKDNLLFELKYARFKSKLLQNKQKPQSLAKLLRKRDKLNDFISRGIATSYSQLILRAHIQEKLAKKFLELGMRIHAAYAARDILQYGNAEERVWADKFIDDNGLSPCCTKDTRTFRCLIVEIVYSKFGHNLDILKYILTFLPFPVRFCIYWHFAGPIYLICSDCDLHLFRETN